MADIFISYAREDQERAKKVASAFEAHGWSVWFDQRLLGGQSWDESIERELTAARRVVVLWSGASVKSRWVRNEARRAADKLVPAALDSAKWPIEFDHLQVVNLTDWNGDGGAPEFQRLVDAVAQVIDRPPTIVEEKWGSRIWRRRRGLASALAMAALVGVAVLFSYQPWAQPRVLLMDSPLPEVVYDKSAVAKGQTNATVIADILKDLPVDVIKESTDLEWHREADIKRMNPALIIIHGSAFYSQTNGSDNAGKLLSFLESMKDADSQFLVYTRVSVDGLEAAVRQRIPGARARFRFWQVPGGNNANFNDPATRRRLIQIVHEVLGT